MGIMRRTGIDKELEDAVLSWCSWWDAQKYDTPASATQYLLEMVAEIAETWQRDEEDYLQRQKPPQEDIADYKAYHAGEGIHTP